MRVYQTRVKEKKKQVVYIMYCSAVRRYTYL